MGPLEWYCKPVENGAWTRVANNAFGAYTPCGVDTLVICISHFVLLGLCLHRIWKIINKDFKVKRFRLKSNIFTYLLGLFAFYSTVEPLCRLLMKYSIFNLDGQTSLAPFEIVSLLIEAITWCSMLVMLFIETKVYIHELRWYVRFGVIYVLVGEAVMFNLIFSVQDYFNRFTLYLYVSEVFCQVLFGIFLLFYVPSVEPYLGYTPLRDESFDNAEYEVLPGGEQICPERHANILSWIYFGWMTPLMQQGYKRPITEKDVWKLDTWDQTETLNNKYACCSCALYIYFWVRSS
ncbi:hypothetical protein IFM89_010748 [Coptis chinensis]|uniref:Uncharacterized protein n=1 Tax=Coptis chinensis TaxID=261450 RepID=A0A835IR24_9MAGN|nr:hypothetical protein IFM89_010748 [Coptis chinensis]